MIYFKYTQAQSAGAVEYQLHLCSGVTPPHPQQVPGYDTKQSDNALGECRDTHTARLLSLLPGPLGPEVVAPDRVLSRVKYDI